MKIAVFMAGSEAVVRSCSLKKVFLKISHNSQETTCFPVNCEIFKSTFFYRQPPVAASVGYSSKSTFFNEVPSDLGLNQDYLKKSCLITKENFLTNI